MQLPYFYLVDTAKCTTFISISSVLTGHSTPNQHHYLLNRTTPERHCRSVFNRIGGGVRHQCLFLLRFIPFVFGQIEFIFRWRFYHIHSAMFINSFFLAIFRLGETDVSFEMDSFRINFLFPNIHDTSVLIDIQN